MTNRNKSIMGTESSRMLHDEYCIDEWDAEWYVVDLPEGAIIGHVASFEEDFDTFDATGTNQHGGGCNNVRCRVREAIW